MAPAARGGLVDSLIKAYFCSTWGICILLAWLNGRLAHLLLWPFLSKKRLSDLSARGCAFFYWLIYAINPFVSLKALPGSAAWSEVFRADRNAPMVLMNHSSMLDGFAFTASVPLQYVGAVRTLGKAALFKLPVFGGMMTDCGHFPVHFSSSKLGSFSVDKEKQAKVTAKMDAHIAAGGAISVFPEGQVNRGDYTKLQSFRRGSLAIAKKHQMEIYGFLMVGVTEAWPTEEGVPGHAADVRTKLFKIKDVDTSLDLPAFTSSIEAQMQAEMDSLVAEVGGAKKTA